MPTDQLKTGKEEEDPGAVLTLEDSTQGKMFEVKPTKGEGTGQDISKGIETNQIQPSLSLSTPSNVLKLGREIPEASTGTKGEPSQKLRKFA